MFPYACHSIGSKAVAPGVHNLTTRRRYEVTARSGQTVTRTEWIFWIIQHVA